MKSRSIAVAFLVTNILGGTSAFSSTMTIPKPDIQARRMTIPPLHMSSLAAPHEDESTCQNMLSKAREYAFSDDNKDGKKAQDFLDNIFHMEILCASGVVAGDVCENVDEVAAVVVRLREIAANTAGDAMDEVRSRSTSDTWEHTVEPFLTVVMSTMLIPPAVLSLLILASTIDWGRGHEPMSVAEWALAARDGYFLTMATHFLRNGGL